jgi:hypothetical protein
MIEGTVEYLTGEGIFGGWLRDTRDPIPAHVQIRRADEIVAESLAASFRPDLLRGGHGHGHYGFLARARVSLPPGMTRFELFLPRHDQGIPVRLEVPEIPLPIALPVEALLRPEPTWAVPDLAAALPCLGLPAQCATMGTPRFVDVAYHFVLQRWPLVEEAAVYITAIDEGGITPDSFLAELLASRERADLGPALPSPWDAAFPFAPAADKERA